MTGTNTTMQWCKIWTIFGALVILAHCMPPNIGKESFRYDPNSIEQNEKVLKLFLRLAIYTVDRLIRLRNEVKHSQDGIIQDAYMVETESSPAVRFYENDTKDMTVRDLPDEEKIVINENPKDPHQDDKDSVMVPRIMVEHTSKDENNVEDPEIDNRSLFSISKNYYVSHYNDHLTNTDDDQTTANQPSEARGKSKMSGAANFAVSIGRRAGSNRNAELKLKSGILSGEFVATGSRNAESNSEKNVAASQLNYEATKKNAVSVQQNARSKAFVKVGGALQDDRVNTGDSDISKNSNLNVNIAHHVSEAQKHSGKVISSVEEGGAKAYVNMDKEEESDETISELKIDELAMKFIDALKPAEKSKARTQWVKVVMDTSGYSGNEIAQKKNANLAIDLQGTRSRKSQSSGATGYAQNQGNVRLDIVSNNENNNVASSAVHNIQTASAPIIILQDSRSRSEISNNQNDHSWNSNHAATIVNSHGSMNVSPVIVRRKNGEFQRTLLRTKYPEEYQNSVKIEKNVGLQIGPLRQAGHLKTEGSFGLFSNEERKLEEAKGKRKRINVAASLSV